MIEYHKIYGPFKRETEGPNRNRLIHGAWTKPEFEYLADNDWFFTEKIDGTNIRVHWDGHKPVFGGRTDRAQIPASLVAELQRLFPEEIFEQTFGSDEVILYGEGYGAGIQKGGKYSDRAQFALFDVRIGSWWLRREDVEGIASGMGINVAPVMFYDTLRLAIDAASYGIKSIYGDFYAEGVVGTPVVPMFARDGSRVIVKVKHCDFFEEEQ